MNNKPIVSKTICNSFLFCITFPMTHGVSFNVFCQLSYTYLGLGWAGNTVNTIIFRHHGVLTFGEHQYTAFYKDQETLVIIRRNLTTDDLDSHTIKETYNVFDAHNSISLGLDKDGFIHLSYDHHGHNLRYQLSKRPYDISEWHEPAEMTGLRENRVTYPAFLMNHVDSALLFLFRDGGATNGQACLKTYDTFNRQWNDIEECIMSGRNQRPWSSNPFWNHPVFDDAGNLHISYA